MRAIVPTLLVMFGWLQTAQIDEETTFCGNTVDGWLRVLRDETSPKRDRQRAMWAFACFGPAARAAVPDLIDEVRRGPFKDDAIDALVGIGAGTEVTVPALIEQFLKGGCEHHTGQGAFIFHSGVRSVLTVRDSLIRIGGPAVPALLDVLNGPNREMRVCAAEALGEIGPAARAAIPLLIRAIENRGADGLSELLAWYAVAALGQIGPEAKAAAPILNGLRLEKPDRHYSLVRALEGIGVPPVRSLLDTFLREGNADVANDLARLGPTAREAAPALRDALTDKRMPVRISAALALSRIDPSGSEAIPVLIEALDCRDDDDQLRWNATVALAQFGPRAKAAMPALIGLAKKGFDDANRKKGDDERDVIIDGDIFKALAKIDPEGKECIPTLISALKLEDTEVVADAAKSLGMLGPHAAVAVPSLAAAVTRDFNVSDFGFRGEPQVNAATALRRIGPAARSAIPALTAALKYRRIVTDPADGEVVRRDSSAAAAAARTLGSFGADAKGAVPALIEAVRTRQEDQENWPLRRAAILALGQIGPDAKAALPVLRDTMKEDRRYSPFQPELMVALYRLAPDGKELAETWLAKPIRPMDLYNIERTLEGPSVLLGMMGRSSFESDWMIRQSLARLESRIGPFIPWDGDRIESYDWWFEKIGGFGRAGRAAIPRLIEFRAHPNPWVRRWATEAIQQIMSPSLR